MRTPLDSLEIPDLATVNSDSSPPLRRVQGIQTSSRPLDRLKVEALQYRAELRYHT